MKEKGFTLIELLAVIVILSVIALIATPIIIDIVDNAKKSSFTNSAYGLIKAADNSFNNTRLTENPTETTYTFVNGVETKESGNVNLSYNGEKPQNGTVVINSDGDIALAIHNGKYCVSKWYTDKDVIVEEKVLVECEITMLEPPTPVLVEGLIPVYYDDTAMVWKKADVNNSNSNWYSYTNYKWANAVTVTETNRATYISAAVGTTIPMADINTMFVWIPRYRYRISAGTGPREINVKFQLNTAKSAGDAVSTYYTHPAFTFGTEELEGIWVGKFEITGTIENITIKPNLQSIRNQSHRAFFEAIRSMEGSNTYGFGNDSDPHMMENIEWGAVAYLYYSKYGKFGNSEYVDTNKELYFNNSTDYYTGRSKGAPGTGIVYTLQAEGNYTYDGRCARITSSVSQCTTGTAGVTMISDKTLAYGASTTGNIYGIYDMAGGAFEGVMALYYPTSVPGTGIRDCSGYSTDYAPPTACPSTTPFTSQYDLIGVLDSRYYNRYLTTTINDSYIKGDATKEVMGWYDDYNTFATNSSIWIIRGGMHTKYTGAFSFLGAPGDIRDNTSTRMVLMEK